VGVAEKVDDGEVENVGLTVDVTADVGAGSLGVLEGILDTAGVAVLKIGLAGLEDSTATTLVDVHVTGFTRVDVDTDFSKGAANDGDDMVVLPGGVEADHLGAADGVVHHGEWILLRNGAVALDGETREITMMTSEEETERGTKGGEINITGEIGNEVTATLELVDVDKAAERRMVFEEFCGSLAHSGTVEIALGDLLVAGSKFQGGVVGARSNDVKTRDVEASKVTWKMHDGTRAVVGVSRSPGENNFFDGLGHSDGKRESGFGRVETEDVHETRDHAFGEDAVTLRRRHDFEAAPEFVSRDEILRFEGSSFYFSGDTNVGTKDLDGVGGAEILEILETVVVFGPGEVTGEGGFASRREPFALDFVRLEAASAAGVHVHDGSILGENSVVGHDCDVVEVGHGADARHFVEVVEDIIDDEGEEDGTRNSTLTSTSFGGDDGFIIAVGVRTNNVELSMFGVS
jgi:hypothetical protein